MPRKMIKSRADYRAMMRAKYKSGLASARARHHARARGLLRERKGTKEAGYVDLGEATYVLDSTGSIQLLATVAQGTSINERVGKKAAWKSVQFRGYANTGASTPYMKGAWLIVYDKRPTGSLPNITDILEAATPTAMNNTQNEGRFRIVFRSDFVLTGNDTTAGQINDSSAILQDQFIDMKGMPVVYKAAGTGAIGDIDLGALYLVTVGSNAAGVTAGQLNGQFRVRFWDV